VRAAEDKAAAGLSGAKAALSAAAETAATAKLEHDWRTVRAPVDGTLLAAPRWVGAVVDPEHSPLAVIGSDPGVLRIDASVAEADIGAVRIGQEAEFTVPRSRTARSALGWRSEQVIVRTLEPRRRIWSC